MIVEVFIVLLVVGLLLIGAEIFVPGAVLGIIGGVCLLGAIIAGFVAFPGLGPFIAVGIILLVGVALALWMVVFPKTAFGKRMTVVKDLSASKASAGLFGDLLGKEGEAVSDLRPSGFVLFDTRRVDVLTKGDMISKGTRVKVVLVEGSRVFVAKAQG